MNNSDLVCYLGSLQVEPLLAVLVAPADGDVGGHDPAEGAAVLIYGNQTADPDTCGTNDVATRVSPESGEE